jgi:hypothetical protein
VKEALTTDLNQSQQSAAPPPPVSGVIQVHVREIDQLFNSIDPSPFREKDLDDDAHEFILSWAKELPANQALTLLVHLDRPAVPPDADDALRQAVQDFFKHRAELAAQRLRQLLRTGRTSLLIGLMFLAACVLGGDWIAGRFHDSGSVQILRESLLIGGWVAMWRPLEIFLYDWWPIRNEGRIYRRLSQMNVQIRCAGKAEGLPAA